MVFNPKCKIIPSIAFMKDRGPVVITCYAYNGGKVKFMINPCLWKHNLPSRRSDQLCQAVIQPRISKPVKSSKCFTRYQVFHQSETFNIIDTCSVTSYGNFNSTSKLLVEFESRSISNRPDINDHLKELRSRSIMAEFVESRKHEFGKEYPSSINYTHYTKGATYLSIEEVMILQNEMTNRRIRAWIDRRDIQPVIFYFNKY